MAGSEDSRLSGWRLAAVRGVLLALAGLNALAVYLLVVGGETSLVDVPDAFDTSFGFMYPSALVSGAVATIVVILLALRGRGRRDSLALALAMGTYTFFSLAVLSLVSPWDLVDRIGIGIVTAAIGFLPVFPLVGAAAFLRFAVLFPRPLTAAELAHVNRVEAGDSLDRGARAMNALERRLFRRNAPGEPADGRVSGLLDRLPARLRRWAERPVVADSGRVLTQPRALWTTALALTLAPFAVFWIETRVPAVFAMQVGPTSLLGWITGLVLIVWMIVPVAGLVLGIVILRFGYGLAEADDRRRMRWIVESLNAVVWIFVALTPFAFASMAGLENLVMDAVPGIFFGVIPLIVVTGFAVAVFYDGALEPSLVIRKSTLYGLFGFGLAFLFAVTEELVTDHLAASVALPEGTGTLVASGVIAVAFGAFHGRFNRKVKDWLDEPEGAGRHAADREGIHD